jgi:hypothetical protein
LLAVLGVAAVLIRSWKEKAGNAERFVVAVIVSLTMVRALLADKVTSRYLADVWLLWELLAAWALVGAVAWATRKLPVGGEKPRYAAVFSLALLAVVLLPGLQPVDTVVYLGRDHGEPPPAARRVVGYTADQRGAAAWLNGRLAAGDRIVATDWLTTYCYLGRLDAWLNSETYARQSILVDGKPRDIYLGAEVLTDVEGLESYARSQRVWIVVGGDELTDPDRKLSSATLDWLTTQEPLYVARDGQTRVLRIGPAGMAP